MTTIVDELIKISCAISRGEIPPYQHNECYTAGAFDLLVVNAHGAEAFDLLQAICARYDSVKSSERSLRGYFDLIAQLARQSGTTEMPQGLGAIIAQHPDLSGELQQWYRLQD
jgi:hypothetical protein